MKVFLLVMVVVFVMGAAIALAKVTMENARMTLVTVVLQFAIAAWAGWLLLA